MYIFSSLFKHKINGHYQANKCSEMIPLKRFSFKKDCGKHCENYECNHFLNNFELHQCKRTAIVNKPYPVGWNLTRILT